MDEGVAAIIGALAGGFGGFITAKLQFRQKSDELLLIALEYLGGGSQKRNVGISALELYWNNTRHKEVCLSLLIGSAIYLLRDSKQDDKGIELYNLQRIMTFILEKGALRKTLRGNYENLLKTVIAAKTPKDNDSLKVDPNDLTDWEKAIGKILNTPKIESFNKTYTMDNKEKYYNRLTFEHELINHRITWLLTSQSVLFAAYGFTADKTGDDIKLLLNTIAWAGPLISLLIALAIITSYLAKWYARKTYRDESGDKDEPLGVRSWITFMGFIAEISLPIVFIIAWAFVLFD